MASGVAVVLGSLLAMQRMQRRPVAPVGGVATPVERNVLRVRPGCSAKGPTDGGLALVKVRTVSEGCSHARRGSYRRGSTGSWHHSGECSVRHVRTVRGKSTPGWNSAGNSGTVTGVGGRDSGHVGCTTWPLTPSDTRAMRWSGWP
jgi:hypothetical protein